jgi:hypothetical protein
LDVLKAELEQLGGVPISSQILMTSFGIQLKSNMIDDANKAAGKVKDQVLCLFFFFDLIDRII